MCDDYVIDFARINELTVHPNDNPNSTGFSPGTFCYHINRKLIREYLDIYIQYPNTNKITEQAYRDAVKNLNFNKILLSKNDIREKRIDEIIKK